MNAPHAPTAPAPARPPGPRRPSRTAPAPSRLLPRCASRALHARVLAALGLATSARPPEEVATLLRAIDELGPAVVAHMLRRRP